MPVLAIQKGIDSIPRELIHPAFGELVTYMRGGFRRITMEELIQKTITSIRKAEQEK